MEAQINQLYNPILFYIKKRINNDLDAEDLTQEVFYKLAKSNMDEVKNMKSWIYSIARNTIIDYYRKKKIPMTDMDDYPVSEPVDEKEAVADLVKCIVPFIQQLPEDYQQLLTLSELENISQKEIAERLKMNYVTVRSKIQRGRKKLKILVSNCCTVIQGGQGSIIRYKPNGDCTEDCNS